MRAMAWGGFERWRKARFIDNLLVRINSIIVMIRWTGLSTLGRDLAHESDCLGGLREVEEGALHLPDPVLRAAPPRERVLY